MNRQQKKETTTVVAVFTATATIAISLLMASDAFAADTTKTKAQTPKYTRVAVVHRKKPVYVKLHGDNRVADAYIRQQVLAAQQAEAALEAQKQAKVEDIGTAYVESGNNSNAFNNNGPNPFIYGDNYGGVQSMNLPQAGGGFTQQYIMPDSVYGGGPIVIAPGSGPFISGYSPAGFYGDTVITHPNGTTYTIPGSMNPFPNNGYYFGF